MVFEIDFDSDEALYLQLYHQIIYGIAIDELRDGQPLPSIRQLAERIGINMHTVNKAYSCLCEEGFLQVDRRKGVFIRVEEDRAQMEKGLSQDLRHTLAKAYCKNFSREEIHKMIDSLYDEFDGKDR